MRCEITGINHQGEGVGRIDGKVVFVPNAIPGEHVDVEITSNKKNYLQGRLQKIFYQSPERVEPECPHYYNCGGCAYQHMTYNKQLELKRQVVSEALKRIGGLEAAAEPVIDMQDPWCYRNKVEWHVGLTDGQVRLGYYRSNTNRLIKVQNCSLISKEMQALTDYIKANLHRLQVSYPYNLIIRQSSHTKGLMVIFKGKKLGPIKTDWLQEYKGLESVYAIENNKQALLWGRPYLYEEIGGINYRLSPLSFFQVNHVQTSKMINLVYANINRTDSLLDAYCGVGSIALYLSGKAHKVVGVENFLPAVENARSNAALNNISNCNFICGACEQIIPAITEQFDAVVIDPPRAGCNGDLMEALIKQAPSEVLYISCNPATLARDLKQMASYYRIKLIQPIDMFPQTYHVETVVLMSKVDK